MELSDETLLREALGMSESKAGETLKNANLLKAIRGVIEEGGNSNHESWSPEYRTLVYEVATRFPKKSEQHRPLLMRYVAEGKVTRDRLALCLDFFKKMQHKTVEEVSVASFEESCGIGVEVSEEEIRAAIDASIAELAVDGWDKYGKLLGALRGKLKFADGLLLKKTVDGVLTDRFGERVSAKKGDKKKNKPAKAPKSAEASEPKKDAEEVQTLKNVKLHRPEENVQVTDELLAEHLRRTGGQGYLHLGHCKSMNLNFGYAERENGICFLRFDDTNPTKEKHEYIDSIIEHHVKAVLTTAQCAKWFGCNIHKVTYSSDYFPQLYAFAEQLINDDKAYVCHETAEEMHAHRDSGTNSRWRDRPTAESLRLFRDMRKGKFDEGEATLRLKIDMQSTNPIMRDPVAYRIMYFPHPRTGNKWCIYPTYDYTHCICDSLEDITHSLCTIEFDIRREGYEWLNRALGIYCPPQIEFSRLNVSNFLMSKRRIIKLVNSGIVRGWDDPRLATIVGLRRRGYTPEAIKDLCERVGISRNANMIDIAMLEDCARDDLNANAPRGMGVMDPIKVVCDNFDEGRVLEVVVPDFPERPECGTHVVPFSKVFYIDRSDFMTEAPKGYFRLRPGGTVGVRHVHTCEGKFSLFRYVSHSMEADDDTRVAEVHVELEELSEKPKKAHYIQFVAAPAGQAPRVAEFRLYENLFEVPRPSELGEDWERAINPNSEVVVRGYVDAFVGAAKPDQKFQLERIGYFNVDPDTNSDMIVLNRTVSLRAARSKTA